jgi:hypothetical protein
MHIRMSTGVGWGQNLRPSAQGQSPHANFVKILRYGSNAFPVEPAAHPTSLLSWRCPFQKFYVTPAGSRRLHAAHHRAVPAMPLE